MIELQSFKLVVLGVIIWQPMKVMQIAKLINFTTFSATFLSMFLTFGESYMENFIALGHMELPFNFDFLL